MAGGTTEVHRDDEPLMTGTHDGGGSATVLRDMDASFRSFGVLPGLAIMNETKGYFGTVLTVTATEVTAEWASDGAGTPILFGAETLWFGPEQVHFEEGLAVWDNGDTYNIYKTDARGSLIATTWTDTSRGWKVPEDELQDGWMAEDLDLDRNDPGGVFGPGQPELER